MINTRLKMGFCWMPKMGSMFWKRAWSVMNFAPSRVPTRPFISQMWAIKLQDFFDTQVNDLSHLTCNILLEDVSFLVWFRGRNHNTVNLIILGLRLQLSEIAEDSESLRVYEIDLTPLRFQSKVAAFEFLKRAIFIIRRVTLFDTKKAIQKLSHFILA